MDGKDRRRVREQRGENQKKNCDGTRKQRVTEEEE